jgi:hypothetical protein
MSVRAGSTGMPTPAPTSQAEAERRALLLRMGSGPSAWAYLDTLARALGMSRNALKRSLGRWSKKDSLPQRKPRPASDTD